MRTSADRLFRIKISCWCRWSFSLRTLFSSKIYDKSLRQSENKVKWFHGTFHTRWLSQQSCLNCIFYEGAHRSYSVQTHVQLSSVFHGKKPAFFFFWAHMHVYSCQTDSQTDSCQTDRKQKISRWYSKGWRLTEQTYQDTVRTASYLVQCSSKS